jgi:hypothetical protein
MSLAIVAGARSIGSKMSATNSGPIASNLQCWG